MYSPPGLHRPGHLWLAKKVPYISRQLHFHPIFVVMIAPAKSVLLVISCSIIVYATNVKEVKYCIIPYNRMTSYNRALKITRCESIETTLRTSKLMWAGPGAHPNER